MNSDERRSALNVIKSKIDKFGHYNQMVSGGPKPRWAYTIGLYPKIGYELVFAGGCYFDLDEVGIVLNRMAEYALSFKGSTYESILVQDIGLFTLRRADVSWGSQLLIGALNIFSLGEILPLQVIPSSNEHLTIDIPLMSDPYCPVRHPVWGLSKANWPFSVSVGATIGADLAALRGNFVAKVLRWEEDYWEMYSNNPQNVNPKEMRVVTFGTLVGYDQSLIRSAVMPVGSTIWRVDESSKWKSRTIKTT